MAKLTAGLYTKDAIERAREDAVNWLSNCSDGYPRTWEQENADCDRRGYEIYDRDFCAPPIAGYEELEREGIVTRLTDVTRRRQKRAHFVVTSAGRAALKGESDG